AKAFFSELVGLIRHPGSTVYLDLSGVTFFDSHAVSALIRARKIAEVRSVNLVVSPSPPVTHILRRAGLSDQFRWGARPAPEHS
ncbi:MAG: STAS domain-containing protein, partial [Acidimicrobiia bacterium]